ncbi:chloramphenicol acetyltransferase [Aquimarina sp. 2201CG5-10]|uniref:chloramphenicol acetyltransferase n=1 Tax=Aquimarina callyspongiae TaxID=3098150 RepID=UPI002AB39E14|nr:chloramphenicol acetyltransferase [Aquimarina sp. 2201CG5-10]MDY8136182.1 chloramphenicol acetyltransferase [Aquimarina sp. 2201CG5-10]
MRKELDLDNWNRKEHFEFFGSFDEPFFGITTTVDFTIGYQKIKDLGYPYFLYYLHKSLVAANAIEAFRYRVEGDKIYVYDKIHASPTIGREDHTFGFSFLEFEADFKVFQDKAQKEIKEVKNSKGLRHTENTKRIDTVHFSSIPWYNFTGITHARHFQFKDSVPKISFGRYAKDHLGKINLPIAINVHHGLMDGYHVGEYLEKFQTLLNS